MASFWDKLGLVAEYAPYLNPLTAGPGIAGEATKGLVMGDQYRQDIKRNEETRKEMLSDDDTGAPDAYEGSKGLPVGPTGTEAMHKFGTGAGKAGAWIHEQAAKLFGGPPEAEAKTKPPNGPVEREENPAPDVDLIHQANMAEYQEKLDAYNKNGGERPIAPERAEAWRELDTTKGQARLAGLEAKNFAGRLFEGLF